MTPSAINTLFGIQATPAAAAKPASTSPAFGDMLSREINGRQPADRPAPAPVPAPPQQASKPFSDNRPPQANAGDAPKPAERNDVAARQNKQADSPQPDRSSEAVAGDSTRTPNAEAQTNDAGAPAADSNDKVARTIKKDKTEKANKTDKAGEVEDNPAAASATDPATVSAASAALLALVNSLSPKAGATADSGSASAAALASATAATAGAIDSKALLAKGAVARPGTDLAGANAHSATTPTDPAFDALLAQAATSTQARDAAKAGGGKPAQDATDLPGAAQLLERGVATPAAASIVKADDILQAASVVQAAGGKGEPAATAGLPGLAGALPAGLVQAAAGTAPDTLAPQVGTPAWDHVLGQKVVWMAAGAQHSASLTLNPPDLGPIQVVINVTNAQADASFTAAQPEVRLALEAAMPRLKEMLGDAGITLGQASVNAGNPNQNGAEQQARSGATRGSGGAGREPIDNEPVTRTTRIVGSGLGMVDTFA